MTTPGEPSITTLPEQVAALPREERVHCESLFQLTRSTGRLDAPPEMHAWICETFGSLAALREQTVIKTLNRWTLEGTLFNPLRARRPVAGQGAAAPLDLAGDGSDPFCHPLTETTADTFGRIRGVHTITASNVAKYEGQHAVVIFDEHDPLALTPAQVADGFSTAARWLAAAHQRVPTAVYPFIMWNCLPRAGASQVHAHLQVTLGEGGAYGRVELWRRAALAYRQAHETDYFAALYAVHDALGLARRLGPVGWLAHLTPCKEKEVIFLAPALGDAFYGVIAAVLRQFIEQLGVQAFNLAVYLPPVTPVAEDWTGFPVVGRLVDRGDPASATSDIGAMELFAQPVVTFDPWRLARVLHDA